MPKTNTRIYDDIPRSRGHVVRVSRATFGGAERADIRLYYEYRPGDPDSRRPSKTGIAIPLRDLSRLLAALRQIEADAIAEGRIRPGTGGAARG